MIVNDNLMINGNIKEKAHTKVYVVRFNDLCP